LPEPAPPASPPAAPKTPQAAPKSSSTAPKSPSSAPKASSAAPKSSPPAPKVAPASPRRPPAAAKGPSATVVDASGLVLGRAASKIAQRLLAGESIVVVNAEQAVVTGSRSSVLATYIAARARGSVRSGPHFPRYPDRIFRRTVRGMLPHLQSRGKAAFALLQVHIGIPPELSGAPRVTIDEAKARPALRAPMTLAEITRLLGARL